MFSSLARNVLLWLWNPISVVSWNDTTTLKTNRFNHTLRLMNLSSIQHMTNLSSAWKMETNSLRSSMMLHWCSHRIWWSYGHLFSLKDFAAFRLRSLSSMLHKAQEQRRLDTWMYAEISAFWSERDMQNKLKTLGAKMLQWTLHQKHLVKLLEAFQLERLCSLQT